MRRSLRERLSYKPLERGGFLLTFLGAVFGLDAFLPTFGAAWAKPFTSALLLGLLLTTLAYASIIIWHMNSGRRHDYTNIIVRPADEHDLDGIYELGKALVSPEVERAPLDGFLKRNPNFIMVARRRSILSRGRKLSEVVGYYIMLPIGQKLYEKWRLGAVDGLNLQSDDIHRVESRAYAICLLVVAGVNPLVSGMLIQNLRDRLLKIAGLKFVFCRPITEAGFRSAASMGFTLDPTTAGRKPGPLHIIDVASAKQSGDIRILKVPAK